MATCDGCRYDQDRRCNDRTVYGIQGGDLPTDDGPRLCYEARQYLSEGLTLYLIDLVRKQKGKDAPCGAA